MNVQAPTHEDLTPRQTAVVLTLLIAAHLAVRFRQLFFESSGDWTQLALNGIMTAQPLLVAMFSVLAPVRLGTRLSIGAALWALPAIIDLYHSEQLEPLRTEYVVASYALGFLLAMAPYAYLYRVRRWRVRRVAEDFVEPVSGGQFGLSALMITVTAICFILAVGRGVYHWFQSPSEEGRVWMEALIVGGAFGLSSALVAPCLGLVLANRNREWFALWTVVGVLGSAAMLHAWTSVFLPFEFTVLLAACYGSALFTLYAVRLCGFRLIQVPGAPKVAPTGPIEPRVQT